MLFSHMAYFLFCLAIVPTEIYQFFLFWNKLGETIGLKKWDTYNWNARFALITLTEKKSDQLCKNTSSSNIGTYNN